MARGRMLSKSLSTSWKFAVCGASYEAAGHPHGEFPQLLFTLLVVHADDFGRLPGDAFTVKMRVLPTSPRGVDEFSEALDILAHARLIVRYLVDEQWVIQVLNFDEHQVGLHKRTRSFFPEAPGPSGKFLDFHMQGKGTGTGTGTGTKDHSSTSTPPTEQAAVEKSVENSENSTTTIPNTTKTGRDKHQRLFKQLVAIAHRVIEDGAVTPDQWTHEMKHRCIVQGVPYAQPDDPNNVPMYRRALIYAEHVRVKRGALTPST